MEGPDVERGLAYHRANDYEQALADYHKGIELDPNEADAHYYRGMVYYNRIFS